MKDRLAIGSRLGQIRVVTRSMGLVEKETNNKEDK